MPKKAFTKTEAKKILFLMNKLQDINNKRAERFNNGNPDTYWYNIQDAIINIQDIENTLNQSINR